VAWIAIEKAKLITTVRVVASVSRSLPPQRRRQESLDARTWRWRAPTAHQFISPSPQRQSRLSSSLTSCPEMIFANDNLVGGTIVAELLFATTIAGADGGCLDAT
jgi:hypothetical protein